jgi:urease accessory protein
LNDTVDNLALLRLLQLASPGLPVGAYAYSQGLEWAVDTGWVSDEASLKDWIKDQLSYSIGRVDLPIFSRLYCAVDKRDETALRDWSRQLLAQRDTRELVDDDCDRGRALARLLRDLDVGTGDDWIDRRDVPFALVMAIAAVNWEIPLGAAMHAYAWSWLENQILAGVKLVPLGQVAGQRLLLRLAQRIPAICKDALVLEDSEIGGMLPIVAIASSLHETQYTRLFRS